MVSIPKGLEDAVMGRAKEKNRAVANYIETLIIDDLNRADEPKGDYIAAEDPAGYGEGKPVSKHLAAAAEAGKVADRALGGLLRSKTKRQRRGVSPEQ